MLPDSYRIGAEILSGSVPVVDRNRADRACIPRLALGQDEEYLES